MATSCPLAFLPSSECSSTTLLPEAIYNPSMSAPNPVYQTTVLAIVEIVNGLDFPCRVSPADRAAFQRNNGAVDVLRKAHATDSAMRKESNICKKTNMTLVLDRTTAETNKLIKDMDEYLEDNYFLVISTLDLLRN